MTKKPLFKDFNCGDNPDAVLLLCGTKMSNRQYIRANGSQPYIIHDNRVFSMSDIEEMIRSQLNVLENGCTVAITIGIDK